MQVSEGKLESISRFEKVPADEERLIRGMAGFLQEKMSREFRRGQTRRGAHPAGEASFDFMMQLQKDPGRMPVEDAGVEWSEDDSPFIKVATLHIPAQVFRTREREDLAEDLSFSPAHSLMAHRPIGDVNRARVEIYRTLSEFRHKQNNKSLGEPRK